MKKLLLTILFTTFIFANIGVVSSLKGNASLIRGNITSSLKLGEELNTTDKIVTESNSKVQLIFKDKTIVTIGKNSEIALSAYKFDGSNSKVNLGFKKGLFKVMTGKIGKLNPQAFQIKTNNATIGIRGTQIVGLSTPKLDTIACTSGAINVGDINNNNPVLVNAGQVTFVVPGELPTPPKNLTANELKKLTSSNKKTNNSESNEKTTTEDESIEEENPITTQDTDLNESIAEQVERQTQSTGGAVGAILKTMKGYATTSSSSGEMTLNFHEGQKFYEDSSYYTYNNLSGSSTLDGSSATIGNISFAQFLSGYSSQTDMSEEQIAFLSTFYSHASSGSLYSTFSTSSNTNGIMFGSYNDYYAYGSWATTSGESGQFIVGDITPAATIQSLISSNANYYYSTNLGTFNLNFGDGYMSLSGYFSGIGSVSNSGFSYSDSSYGLNGNFYGPNAEAVGGVLENKTNNTNSIMYGGVSGGV